MTEIIKWFWNSIDFKTWTFEGYKLKSPIRIIWRLLMDILITIFKYVYLFFVLIGHGAYEAKMQKYNMD